MKHNHPKLEKIAQDIRTHILTMSFNAQSAHTGGALSCVEILTALYFKHMKVFPKNPRNDRRDRLVFSKAHDAKALYATLAVRGFFSEEILAKYETNNGVLPGHSTRNVVPGVEASAGSLGHGLPIACGIAYAGIQDKKKFRVYAIISDGECNEGSTWEAILFASHHNLSNLTVIVDYNMLQGYGFTEDVLKLEPFEDKWMSFGWNVNTVEGNNITHILNVLKKTSLDKPTVIIAKTTKGIGGVKKYINTIDSQYKPPTKDEYNLYLKEINK